MSDRFPVAPPERVAVIRALRGLGDMLCFVPALRAMRSAWPQAEITLVGLPWAHIFQGRFEAYLDGVLDFPGYPGIPEAELDPPRLARFLAEVQGQFDLVVQMHGSGTNSNAFATLMGGRVTAGYYLPALWCPDPDWFLPYDPHSHEVHGWLRLAEFLGAAPRGDDLEFPELPGDNDAIVAVWPGVSTESYACLHPGASEPARRWPADRFAAVGDWLVREGYNVILTGSEGERELTAQVAACMNEECVDLAGKTSLDSLSALLRGASLVICNDTGVSHLTTAVGTKSVVVFAASDPGRWAPLDRERHRVVGEPIPEGANACRHTPAIKGHRCLGEGCSSLLLPRATGWRPAAAEEVIEQASDLLGSPARRPFEP